MNNKENKEIDSFIDNFIKEMKNDNVAIFAGAGFSKSSGFVDWKGLPKKIADELELDIEKEYDLVNIGCCYLSSIIDLCTRKPVICQFDYISENQHESKDFSHI